jgi:hypothetical protein
LISDYICDLEATVLVVSSKHHVKEEKSYGQNSYDQNNYGGGNQVTIAIQITYNLQLQGGYGQSNYGGGNQVTISIQCTV